ncbi:hypothetical protein DN752_17650 [Echinicola strongylocentroti]|uniref:DUF2490 domain-containing protein n=1 Tax=Echinicola strongylocentroti TaxID=1795355 RepID=A0A2Z4IM71_9BACT|nr:DUF2490 domain-containing protein [Echinicola strongylocentroti]AWW31807.1 hypothetical protein DN752_17650 [Echinicola strongylocentroti]
MLTHLKRTTTLLILSLLLLSPIKSFAQEKTVFRDNQQWIQYASDVNLSNKWTIKADASMRYRDDFNNKSQYMARSSVHYRIKNQLTFFGGLAYSGYYENNKDLFREIRPFQGIGFNHQVHHLPSNHRFMIEERFIKSRKKAPTAFKRYHSRLRYRFMVSLPLWARSGNAAKKLILRLSNEIFLTPNKTITQHLFNSNRFLVGPEYQFTSGLKASLTYTYQFSATAVRDTFHQSNIYRLKIKQNISL